jgi:hypothetical protein
VKTRWILFLAGMVLFVVSFFLIAVREAGATHSDSGMRGYTCAYVALLSPWGSDGLRMLREGPVDYFAILFSGWINPVFLITVLVLLIRPTGNLAGVLRGVVLVMFLACWIVFFKEHLHPRAGYFLWTVAMLLVLFSGKLVRSGARTPVGKTVDKSAYIS